MFYRVGGDLFHDVCLTEALKEGAVEVDQSNIEPDDICGACDEFLVDSAGVEDSEKEEEEEEEANPTVAEAGEGDLLG